MAHGWMTVSSCWMLVCPAQKICEEESRSVPQEKYVKERVGLSCSKYMCGKGWESVWETFYTTRESHPSSMVENLKFFLSATTYSLLVCLFSFFFWSITILRTFILIFIYACTDIKKIRIKVRRIVILQMIIQPHLRHSEK